MKALLAKVLRFFEYLYYLRFPLLLWWAPTLVAWFADAPGKPSSYLHAIFTPQYWGQFFITAFFAAATGVISLIMARVICLNGPERFAYWRGKDLVGPQTPAILRKALGLESEGWASIALAASQVPTLALLVRLHWNATVEDVAVAKNYLDLLSMLGGLAFAAVFWWVVNLTYYGTYPRAEFHRQARTLLYPRFCFPQLAQLEQADPPTGWVYKAFDWLFRQTAKLGPGYAPQAGNEAGVLYEGHRLTAIGLLGYLTIYGILFPLTAPSIVPTLGWWILGVILLLFLVVALDQMPLLRMNNRLARFFFFIPATVLAAVGWFLFQASRQGRPPYQFFPVLAAVLILVTLVCFFLSGASFFLDRYRLPVLAFVFLWLFLPRAIFRIHSTGEHYFAAHARQTPGVLPTPPQIVSARCAEKNPCNMIFVTATGGGIHAAAWTAGILSTLEQDFQKRQLTEPFHEQLAFASTVSGGSVGLSDFLREYKAVPFPTTTQAMDQAGCSSLEAVGWGLIYSDFLVHFVLPIPHRTPGWDRSASLEAALERNGTGKDCQSSGKPQAPLSLDSFALAGDSFTHYPAFTMNTTAVEKGGRFLLANYQNDPKLMQAAPAASFEQVYNADLNLATAARLSATFPVVSSAARIIPEFSPTNGDPDHKGAAHFVDGGYYDNDGIASAIEFLEDAFLNDPTGAPTAAPSRKTVNIYLIEIRDGYDLDTATNEESAAEQARYASPLGLFGQAGAPLTAFWETGHIGVSRRNYRDLIRLQQALNLKNVHLELDALPFNTRDAPFNTDNPLSWQLTPAQQKLITRRIDSLDAKRDEIVEWAAQHQ